MNGKKFKPLHKFLNTPLTDIIDFVTSWRHLEIKETSAKNRHGMPKTITGCQEPSWDAKNCHGMKLVLIKISLRLVSICNNKREINLFILCKLSNHCIFTP